MDTKWRKSRAWAGFLAFVLGISLTLTGALSLVGRVSTSYGRQWMADSAQGDYQNTARFRSYVADYLETFLAMGSGGPLSDYYHYDDYYDYYGEETWSWSEEAAKAWEYGGWEWAYYDKPDHITQEERAIFQKQAQAVHGQLKEDKNVLYRISKVEQGVERELYTNFDSTAAQAPEEYNFQLVYQNGAVTITKDGTQLDVYGDGYYTQDSAWYVPGYRNFTVDPDAQNLKITLAAIRQPRQFIRGSYSTDGASHSYNRLYWLQQNLLEEQRELRSDALLTVVGVALLAVWFVLRRDKRAIDRAIAKGSGTVWFEVKVLLLLFLVTALFPVPVYWENILEEFRYGWSGNDVVSFVTEQGGWLFSEWVHDLPRAGGALVAIFWAVWLLLFNDWRYNPKPWRHGVFSLLSARNLKHPVQQRLSRMAGAVALATLALTALAVGLLIYNLSFEYGVLELASVWALCTPIILLAVCAAAFVGRQQKLWTELGALTGQITAVRNGDLDHPLTPDPKGDLFQAADDLNHIQQGLQNALENQTRNERMKVELVTNVSHDLKTPLTSIISYTELLAQENLEPPASEYVQILGEKSQRLKAMVQDVFDVSKAASGQLPVNLKSLDFARLLRQTLADMEGAIQNSGLTVRTSLPDQPVPITADSDRMYRVFQNLIGNALKYSLAGSRVYLSLVVEAGEARASVRSTSAAELDPSMDYTARFTRGDGSRSDGGSGLGLSIAESFTRASGGTFRVETTADLFTALVTFPLAEEGGNWA